VNIHKSRLIRNSASICGPHSKLKFTIFHLHKLLLCIGLFTAVILDIKKYGQLDQWDSPAVSAGFSVMASSEQLGSNVRHVVLNTNAYDMNDTASDSVLVQEGSAWCAHRAVQGEWI
jgi:hypothetical protein